MTDYSKITALYSRLSVGDEDRDGGESNSIQNQKIFLENYARGQHLTNIRHYIDDDESGRFFDRSAYSRMMDDVENGKIGVCIMKDLTRWGRDYLQVGNAMEIFRRNNVRFIAVNNGIDSEKPDTLEFAPFINIMSEWYAKDISKKVKTGIKTKGMSGKPIVTEAPYGYVKDPDNKDFWIIDEEAAEVVRLIFRLFIGGKNRNQIAVYLTQEQIPTPTFYMKDRGRGTCKNKTLNEDNRCNSDGASFFMPIFKNTQPIFFKSRRKTYRVPYDYYICNVKLENFNLSHVPVYIMSQEQLSMYATYMSVLGNREDLFGDSPYVDKYITNPPADYDVNPEYLNDEKFATLITEAEKYLGYPYVWGGSNPDTSFDCSGFVSYVLTNSGLVNTGRLGAQGLYNVCAPVSKANAQPGDLIFFVGTYDTPGVSHVGIYVGDGVMIHCGDPIQYTSINSSYWQQHFYAFGRPAY